MEARSKVSGGSEPLKKQYGRPNSSPDTKQLSTFLHARHRETNSKFEVRSSNAINIFSFHLAVGDFSSFCFKMIKQA